MEKEKNLSVLVGGGPSRWVGDAVARWDDTEGRRLETIIGEIAVDVAVLMEQRYREAQVRHHQWLLRQHAEKVEARRQAKIEAERRERERVKKLEQDKIDRLLADADQFRQAQTVRAYVEAASLHGSPEMKDSLERWRTWALALADQIDPVRNGSFLRSASEPENASGEGK